MTTPDRTPPQNMPDQEKGGVRPMTEMESRIWSALYLHGLRDAMAVVDGVPWSSASTGEETWRRCAVGIQKLIDEAEARDERMPPGTTRRTGR